MAKITINDEIQMNCSGKAKKRKKALFDELDKLEEDSITLPSSIFKKPSEKAEKENDDEVEEKDPDIVEEVLDEDWVETLYNFRHPKSKSLNKSIFNIFEDGKKKKKKKQKTKNGQIVNHKREFEPEMCLLQNLQRDQSKFVDSLQKKYDQMENTKSTARGVSKYTTDLILSITSARSLSMQLVDKIISTKKTVADLDFKERKEFGSKGGSEQQNLSNYASTYLKQMMDVGRKNIIDSDSSDYSHFANSDDDDIDDVFSSIGESLSDPDRKDIQHRTEEIDKYLEYEKDDVEIRVIWYDEADPDNIDEKYEFVAYTADGRLLDDYPLPTKTRLSINRETGTAIDIYGNKYKMKFVA